MKRLLLLLLKQPFAGFKIIFYWILIFSLRKKKTKTIVYNLNHDYFYDIFYPIYRELQKTENIKVYFSINFQNKSLVNYLQNKVANNFIISSQISPFIPFDLFICSEITGPDFPFKLFKTKKLETYHGNGISGFYEKKDVLNRFDIHFAIGPKFNEFIDFAYQEKSKKPTVYNVGYPKLDLLLEESELTKKLKELYHIKERPTVLYAPHWNPFGSLHTFEDEIIKVLMKYDINLLIKPHHYLYAKYPELNWQKRLADLAKESSNITIIERPNTQELYPLADMMISDTGTSAPFEFCLLQKPLFVFKNDRWFENETETYEEKRILEASICFENIENFQELIAEYLNESSQMRALIHNQQKKQKELIDELLYNPGKATPKAVEAIQIELGLK